MKLIIPLISISALSTFVTSVPASNRSENFQGRMDELGKQLQVIFDEANQDAQISIETFGEMIRQSFERLGDLQNDTLKEQLKQTADTYESVTRDSVQKYFQGVSESVKGTFENMLSTHKEALDAQEGVPVSSDDSDDQEDDDQDEDDNDDTPQSLQKRQLDVDGEEVSTFQDRMDQLGQDLKIQFDGANADAKTSLQAFGDLVALAFRIMGHPKNDTLKADLKDKAAVYRESTRKASEGYYNGISDSFKETWKNIFNSPDRRVPADVNDRMKPVGEELKVIFEKANYQARESVVAFGLLVKATWIHITDLNNSDKKEALENQADIYVNRTGDSVDLYWNGISKTFNDTFYNLFPGLTNVTLDENSYEELSNYPVPAIPSSAFSIFNVSLWITLAAMFFCTL